MFCVLFVCCRFDVFCCVMFAYVACFVCRLRGCCSFVLCCCLMCVCGVAYFVFAYTCLHCLSFFISTCIVLLLLVLFVLCLL